MTYTNGKPLLAAVFLLGTAALLVFALHLFRVERVENPVLGSIQFKYRWGRLRELWADTNLDGSVDFHSIFDTTAEFLGTHEPPTEYWEDRDYDGVFEVHVLMDGSEIVQVSIDDDFDGKYDRILTGHDASSFYKPKDSL